MITLVCGGARSGKSSFAEKIACHRGGMDVIYLATAEAGDKEMAERIKKHKQSRPQEWETKEESLQVSKVLSEINPHKVILLDCITVLVSNLLLQGEVDEKMDKEDIEARIMKEMEEIITVVKRKKLEIIIVTNEVGMGLVPDNELGRLYRDIAGRVNKYLATNADEVYITFAGLPIEIKEQGLKNIEKFPRDDL